MILDQIPEVTDVALFAEEERIMYFKGNTIPQHVYWSNRVLLDWLEPAMIEGSSGKFSRPDHALISERMALKLGIRGDAINQTLQLYDSSEFHTYQVMGVFKNMPTNSTIHADILLPLEDFLEKQERKTDFGNGDLNVLLKFADGATFSTVDK